MKKVLFKIVSVVLAAALISSLSVCAFAKDEQLVYTGIGDSNAVGYGTSAYVDDNSPCPTSYVDIVGGMLGAKTNRYGITATRLEELINLLDPSFTTEDMVKFSYSARGYEGDLLTPETLDARREGLVKAVKEADIITVNTGGSNFVNTIRTLYVYESVPEEYWTSTQYPDFATPEANAFAAVSALSQPSENMVEQLKKMVDILRFFAEFVPFILKMTPQIYKDFATNWDILYETIRKLNPDALVVVLSVNNPMNATTFNKDDKLPIGMLFDPLYEFFNVHIKYLSKYKKEYLYVDNTDIQLGDDGLHFTEPTFKPHYYVPIHADDAESVIMAQRIYDTIAAYNNGTYKLPVIPKGIERWAKLFGIK